MRRLRERLIRFVGGGIVSLLPRKVIHADYMAELHVTASVRGSDGSVVAGAEAYFVDVGLDLDDPAGALPRRQILLGRTDASGKLDAQLRYRWGRLVVRPSDPPGGRFDIRLMQPSYHVVTITFDLAQLRRTGRAYEIALGNVLLPKI